MTFRCYKCDRHCELGPGMARTYVVDVDGRDAVGEFCATCAPDALRKIADALERNSEQRGN